MGEIADRFRSRLGADWPAPLPAMLDAALAQDSHHPESVVGRVLEEWSADGTVDQVIRGALELDALAFVLSDHHGGEWGDTYFGPWGSGTTKAGEVITAPRRERLTEAAVKHWRSRAGLLEHHVARARLSDAAWDLAPLVGLTRRREDAVRAIDSYIGQCANSRSELHLERCLRRAHTLARDISDVQRAANVRTSLLELCRVAESEACERLRFLACDLYLLDKQSDATDAEKAIILDWMEEGLQRCVEQGDPFDGERFAERLDLHYRRGDAESRQRVARAFGGLLEAWAAKGNGMLAMHNYTKAHKVYQAAGLSTEAKAVRAKVQTATAQTQDEMARLSTSVEIPRDKMDEFVESIVGQEWSEALQLFVAHFLHRREEFEKQLDSWLEGSTMYGLLSQTVITESGDSVALTSPQEDRESHVILKGAEVMRFAEVFMRPVLDGLLVRHEVTPDRFTGLTDDSPLFLDDRRSMLNRAFKAYCLRDWATFLHLAVPQVEHAIRLLFQHAAQKATTTSRDSKRWRTLTLNQILDSSALAELLGGDVLLYLRVVLTHDLGLNMRNLVCHGLVNQSWCNRGRADRLLHVVLLLTLLFRRGAAPSHDQPDEQQGTGEQSAAPS
jgi:hypothetical protein